MINFQKQHSFTPAPNFLKRGNLVRGFTLLETLIYVAIFSLLVSGLISFMSLITTTRVKNQINLEINNQGDFIIRTMTSTLKQASLINSPTLGNTAGTLSLVQADLARNPTIFSISNGTLYMTEGTNSPVALTNNKVTVSNLIFSNLSLAGTPGSLKIQLTLTSNIANINNIILSADFYGSATLRNI